MPYKDPERRREAIAASKAKARARRIATKAEAEAVKRAEAPPWPADPAQAVAAWSCARLVVPPGHPRAGQPLELPDFAIAFLADALAPGVREAALFVARKNGKSAVVAVLILAHLSDDGPLRAPGFRAGVASLSRDKSTELWTQARDIALASALSGLIFGRVPRHIGSAWGRCDFLSADKSAGQASGFDLAIADELGLFPAKGGRELVAGLLSSTSTRDGRLLAISVLGDSDLSREMIERRDDPATVVHVYQAPADCALDSPSAWHAANPGLECGVKSLSYMRDMSRRAAAAPSEQAAFRVFDLNQPGTPTTAMIVAADRFRLCANKSRPDRLGPCFLGIDLGGSTSMTAAAAYWPEVSRLETWGAFGDEPGLADRGEADGVGDRYRRMSELGELRTWPGRVTPVSDFLGWIADELAGESVAGIAADRYRRAECLDAIEAAGVPWRVEWRAQGTGADGSADVRAFQKSIEGKSLRPGESLLLSSAIAESVLRFDANANPALDKRRRAGRIDCLSAAVLAVGMGARHFRPGSKPRPPRLYMVEAA